MRKVVMTNGLAAGALSNALMLSCNVIYRNFFQKAGKTSQLNREITFFFFLALSFPFWWEKVKVNVNLLTLLQVKIIF
jgi:hypothetical protein